MDPGGRSLHTQSDPIFQFRRQWHRRNFAHHQFYRQQSGPNTYANTHRDCDRYAYCHTNGHTHRDCDRHAYCNRNRHTYRNSNGYTHRDCDRHAYCHTNGNSDCNAHTDIDTKTDTNTDAYANRDTNSDAGWSVRQLIHLDQRRQ